MCSLEAETAAIDSTLVLRRGGGRGGGSGDEDDRGEGARLEDGPDDDGARA